MDSSQPSENLLDLEPLESFIDIGYADYSDLLNDVLREVPSALELIRQGVASGDFTEIRTRAHSLKGMLSYFGCSAMTVRLSQLEASHFTTPAQADAVYNELLYIWGKSYSAIKQWEKSVPGFAS